jgi:hypothetical protein
MKSIKNGYWFEATNWDAGRVPLPTDDIILEHQMTADRNIIIENRLYSRKGGITFIGVNMMKFIGGGHSVLPTDVGLWVMKDGQLDMRGRAKTGWTTLTQGLAAGETKFTCVQSGWEVGDLLAISPTALDAYKFSETTIKAISGNEITVGPIANAHPVNINPRSGHIFYPEVINLSRKEVYIKGTSGGQSHVFITSTKPQFIERVLFQHMGPRKDQYGDAETEFVLGRYPVHFHHCLDGSVGSRVTGNVCIDCPNHCYVPHGSNGITFFDNISYRTMQTPYWVDLGHPTDGIIYDHNFAGDVSYNPRSRNLDMLDPAFPDDTPPTFAVHGFEMGMGTNLKAINNCVAGIRYGDPKTGGAYNWEANNEAEAWLFENNTAHNNFNNLRNWQNTRTHHLIKKFVGYNGLLYTNDDGQPERMNIFNGAYGNPYRYFECECFNGIVDAKAASLVYDDSPDGYGQIWNNCIFDEFYLGQSPLPGEVPILLKNSKVGKIVDDAGIASDGSGDAPHNLDVVETTFESIGFGPYAGDKEVIRVQNGIDIYKLTKAGKTTIPKFNFDVIPPTTVYKSVGKRKDFTRNNCPAGYVGSLHTYIVDAGQFESTISQADADAKADADIEARGQNQANTFGTCTQVIFNNTTVSKVFIKNDCPQNAVGSTVTYIVPAGKWTADSQIKADALAQKDIDENGQVYANANGTCTMTKKLIATIKVYDDGSIEAV